MPKTIKFMVKGEKKNVKKNTTKKSEIKLILYKILRVIVS